MADQKVRYVFEADLTDLKAVEAQIKKIQLAENTYASEARAKQNEIKNTITQTRLERQLATEQAKKGATEQRLAEQAVNAELDKQKGILGQLKAELKALKIERDRANDPESIKQLNAKIKETTGEIGKLTEATNYFKGSAGIFRETRNALTAIFALNTVKDWVKGVLDAQSQMDQFQISIETFVKNPAIREKLQADLIAFAKMTKFTLQEVQDQAGVLLARGFDTSSLLPNLKAVAAVSTAVKGEFGLIAKALADVKDKGVLMGQEFLQFSNNKVPLIQMVGRTLSKDLNMPMEEAIVLARKMKDEHKITYDLIQRSFIDASKEGGMYFGILEKGAEKVFGKLSNLSESYTLELAKMGQSSEGFTLKLISVLQRMIEPVGNFIRGFGESVGIVIQQVWSLFNTLTGGQSSVITIENLFRGLTKTIAALAIGIKFPIDMLNLFLKTMEMAGSRTGLFIAQTKNLLGLNTNADLAKSTSIYAKVVKDRDDFIKTATAQNIALKNIFNGVTTPKKKLTQYDIDNMDSGVSPTLDLSPPKSTKPGKTKQEYEVEEQNEIVHQLRMQKIRLQANEDEIKDKTEFQKAILELDFAINSTQLEEKYEKEREKAKGNKKALIAIEKNYGQELEALAAQNGLDLTKIDNKAKDESIKATKDANKQVWDAIVKLAKDKRASAMADVESDRKLTFDKIDIAKNEAIEKLNILKEEEQAGITSKSALLGIEKKYQNKISDLNIQALKDKKTVIENEIKAVKSKHKLTEAEERKYKELLSSIDKELSNERKKDSEAQQKLSLKLKLQKIADAKEVMDYLIGTFEKSENAYVKSVGGMLRAYQTMNTNIANIRAKDISDSAKAQQILTQQITAGIQVVGQVAQAYFSQKVANLGAEINLENQKLQAQLKAIDEKYAKEIAVQDAIINRRQFLEDELQKAILANDTAKIESINTQILQYDEKEAKKKELETAFEEARKTNNVAEIQRIGNELLKYTEADRAKIILLKQQAAERDAAELESARLIKELKKKQIEAEFAMAVAKAVVDSAILVALLSATIIGIPAAIALGAAMATITTVMANKQKKLALEALNYYDGTERLPLGNNKKGRDTIAINAHEGERIMPTRDNDDLRRHFGRDVSNNELVKMATMFNRPRLEVLPVSDINNLINQRLKVEMALNMKSLELAYLKSNGQVVEAIKNKQEVHLNINKSEFNIGVRKTNSYITHKRNKYFGEKL